MNAIPCSLLHTPLFTKPGSTTELLTRDAELIRATILTTPLLQELKLDSQRESTGLFCEPLLKCKIVLFDGVSVVHYKTKEATQHKLSQSPYSW